jgi:hypothetical protein
VVNKQVNSTYADLPIDLKFKSNRIGNYRLYVLGGIKDAIDFSSQSDVITTGLKAPVKLNRNDFGYELGVGVDFYLEFFKFSFEIKAFHGVRDLLVHDTSTYSMFIAGLFSKMFYFNFDFE